MLSAIRAESEKAMSNIEFKICPLCGRKYKEHPAISRCKDQQEICPECGERQAITQWAVSLSRTFSTAGVNSWFADNDKRLEFVKESLNRHYHFDWGDMDNEDKHTNDVATVFDDRIFSAYNIPQEIAGDALDDKIWIITEADRSATTIFFPSEY